MPEPNLVLENSPRAATTREQQLIASVQQGKRELFYELVRPYERRIYAAALAILRNEADAEDVCQEAMLKAFAHIQQFRAEARFSTWLIQITVNEALMRRRRDRTVVMEGLAERSDEEGIYTPRDFADWREVPAEALQRKELRQALKHAIAGLAPKYREVLILRDVQQLSTEETAQVLGVSEGNVKTRLLRARLQMRDELAPGIDGSWSTGKAEYQKVRPW